ncbi:phytanoyl-CoA dioxygenase family protein [Granulicella aggregans]|uniref:phytanoyl-CoA dioxygenase family protein n=1 Tax=Granulicella aggregans TaxID=474949 RepID=UPI0021DF63FE|nr:phytanoyl-CoA dioxygenase family protein [Granulicella aggregans]
MEYVDPAEGRPRLPQEYVDRGQLKESGFYIEKNLIGPATLASLKGLAKEDAVAEEGRGGVRNLLDVAAFRELAESAPLLRLVRGILGDEAFIVRGILFDKTSNSNWKVPWHQDVTIAVTNRIDADGFGPWSIKAGVLHVQPPANVLEKMISVRIHLDDCPAENGALRVLPVTHRQGKLGQAGIEAEVSRGVPVTCEAKAGDALVMRPLLVHASSPSSAPNHRRVLHFDYANVELPNGLEWRERQVFSFRELVERG